MTDAHCHVASGEPGVAELLCAGEGQPPGGSGSPFRFLGVHPWFAADWSVARCTALAAALAADPGLGVGEIGLDRLRAREIPDWMRTAFIDQLDLAAACARPVVLHGAKCWGEVVAAARARAGRIPAFLFHGFSRSGGLLPDIVAMNGFVSVGPQILNDHAINYRALARAIPLDRLLVETDRTAANAGTCPSVRTVLAKLAELRECDAGELEAATDANARRLLAFAPLAPDARGI